MSKKVKLKPNMNVGSEMVMNEVCQGILTKGEQVSDMLLSMMQLVGTDTVGIGAMAIGLSKALTALKVIARRLGVPVDDTVEQLMAGFEREMTASLDEFDAEKYGKKTK